MAIVTNIAGIQPTADMLDTGGTTSEIAINTTDNKLYVKQGNLVSEFKLGESGNFRSEGDMINDRESTKLQTAASGFISKGKHNVLGRIADGLWGGSLLSPNSKLYLGTTNVGSNVPVDSKTDLPIVNIAGNSINLERLGTNDTTYNCEIKFPEAEDGTKVLNYDTGSITEYPTAVEAFEGLSTNGNFRNGGDGWGGTLGTRDFSGSKVRMTSGAATFCDLTRSAVFETGKAYILTFNIVDASTNGLPIYNYSAKDISGVIATADQGKIEKVTYRFTAGTGSGTSTGIDIRSSGADGTWVDITNIQIKLESEQVVTRRVDMWGFELFLEEITNSHPFVYPKGLIQSGANLINGITTVTDNIRPDTYFAVYEGDTTSRGKGVNFFSLTQSQRDVVSLDPTNRIYKMSDGRIAQWRLRQRTISGAGNGDWYSIDSETNNTSLWLRWGTGANPQGKTVMAQGSRDTVQDYITGSSDSAYFNSLRLGNEEKGIFSAALFGAETPDTGLAVNGECYFLVCGTVTRMNKGAYQPEFNEFGARRWRNSDGTGGEYPWYHPNAHRPKSESECFDLNVIDETSGAIGQNSGYPEERFYDAIYSGGIGGLQRDTRYSSYKLTEEDFEKKKLEAISGNTIGREKLVFTQVAQLTSVTEQSSTLFSIAGVPMFDNMTDGQVINFSPSIKMYWVSSSGTIHTNTVDSVIKRTDDLGVDIRTIGDADVPDNNSYFVASKYSDTSVGNRYIALDIVSHPSEILKAFTTGFYGHWIPIIPNGVSADAKFTQPMVVTKLRVSTHTAGLSWTSGTVYSPDTIKNTSTFAWNSVSTHLLYYLTNAKATKGATNTKVYGGTRGLGNVYVSAFSDDGYGRQLCYSLTKKIMTNTLGKGYEFVEIIRNGLTPYDGVLNSNPAIPTTHNLIGITTNVNNSSPGFKIFDYRVSNNGLGNIHFAYTELFNNGSSWGDDFTIHLYNSDYSRTDSNGNLVAVGTHSLVEPLGWV